MYTLRTITEKGVQSNTSLGNDYKVYTFAHPLFKELTKKNIDNDYAGSVKYWILYDNSTKSIPIFKENENYIMTESGKTLQKLI